MEKDIILNNKQSRVFNDFLKDVGIYTEQKTIVIENIYIEEPIHYLIGKDTTIKDVVEDAVKNNISLEYADLKLYCLKGVNLRGSILIDADLLYCNLRNSFLIECSLIRANLTGSILQGADLQNSILRGSVLIDVDFTDSILDGVEVNSNTMINKNTYYTIPDKYKHIFDVCTFLQGLNLTAADLTDSDLRYIFLMNADLRHADLTNADLRRTKLLNTNFTDSILDDVKVNKYTIINKNTYNTIPDKYKYIFDVCNFVD